MKKYICVIISIACILACSGCATTVVDKSDNCETICGHFTVVKEENNISAGSCYTVYDNNTGVMYYIIYAAHGVGMSPIYDEYGNICTYDSDAH